MNKKTKLVLELLKTKASSLGFNKEELEGAATTIASNLGVDDDATDEAMNAAAEKAVAVFIPFLELSQKNANRIIQKNKEEREKAEAENRKKAEEEAKKAEEEARKAEEKRKEEESKKKDNPDESYQKFLESEWAKNMKAENENLAKQFKKLLAEFNTMKEDRLKATRESRLDELVKDAGVYGKRIKDNYALMSFDTEEKFDNFLNGVKEDLKAFNQERADKGLDTLRMPSIGEDGEKKKVEPMTDAEVDALAAIM